MLEQNVSNIREEIGALGNEVQAAFANQNLGINGQFTSLGNRLCESEKSSLTAAFQATIQGMQNTQAIQGQAAANQIVAAENACAIKGLIQAEADNTRSLVHSETDRVIALLNATETQNLRDRILELTRHSDNREAQITITNTATATANQFQQQQQAQTQFLANALNVLGDQIARQTNQLINVGSGTVSGAAQTATNANTKINS